MARKSFYLDSCIWLNLFKKEGDASKGVPFWKLAKDFIEKVEKEDNKIVVSSIVLKELTFQLKDKFSLAKKYFDESQFIELVKTDNSDYEFARKLEDDIDFRIGFYDCLHIAISKRLNITLITRDKELIDVAKEHVKVHKPEHLLN